jgi:hypothetical protein
MRGVTVVCYFRLWVIVLTRLFLRLFFATVDSGTCNGMLLVKRNIYFLSGPRKGNLFS